METDFGDFVEFIRKHGKGMTLYPGLEYTRKVTKEEHLTLASLDCRPKINAGTPHPMAHLVVIVNNCEHVLCYLEKGLVHQQSLDFVFQEGDSLLFTVEGTGILHITGYSVKHTMLADVRDNTRLASPSEAEVDDGPDNNMEPANEFLVGESRTNDKDLTSQKSDLDDSQQQSVKMELEEADQIQPDQIFNEDIKQLQSAIDEEENFEAETFHGSPLQIIGVVTEDSQTEHEAREAEGHHEEGANTEDHDCPTSDVKFQDCVLESTGEETLLLKDVNGQDSPPSTTPSFARLVQSRKRCLKSHGGTTTKQTQQSETNTPPGASQKNSPHDDRKSIYREQYTCSVCGKTFGRRVSFLSHQKTHQGLVTLRCEVCKESSSQKASLNKGKETGHCSHRCQWAGKFDRRLSQRSSLSMKITHPQMCLNKVFSIPSLRNREIIHTTKNQCQCQFCGKVFAKKGNLYRHEKIHSGEKLFKCQFCDKKFVQKIHTRVHEKSHTSEKVFTCQFCQKRFITKYAVEKHERIHTGERPFKCQFCEKRFVQKCHMTKHEKVHTGEELFSHDFCSISFQKENHCSTT